MEDLDKIIQRLYEDSVLGKLSDLRFQKLSAQYETEQAEIQRLASSLEQEIENEERQIADVGRFLQLADRYSDLQELDASTVNELIDKIVIHSPERIRGKKHVTIEVYFLMGCRLMTGLLFSVVCLDAHIFGVLNHFSSQNH